MIEEGHLADEYYQALLDRNSQYLGVFYVGVKTTRVFCVSTCRARKPKRENVSFYRSSEEAMQHGFRPCKVCQPLAAFDDIPEDIAQLLLIMRENPQKKITDSDILDMGFNPSRIRRWFTSNYNLTFHAYQRAIRLNVAVKGLKNGERVTSTAFSSGYESLSGFGYTFKNAFQTTPEKASEITLIYHHKFSTPLGPMYAAATENGLCLLEFADRPDLEKQIQSLSNRLHTKIITGTNQYITATIEQLREYFEGSRKEFDIPLVLVGSDFQQKVWQELIRIPFGTTRSYKRQSEALGDMKAIRAVASANGQNKIAIVVPCHRVIGSDGSLTGYAGGLSRKKWLLDHERSQLSLFS